MEKLKSPRLSYSFVAKLPLKSLYSKIFLRCIRKALHQKFYKISSNYCIMLPGAFGRKAKYLNF